MGSSRGYLHILSLSYWTGGSPASAFLHRSTCYRRLACPSCSKQFTSVCPSASGELINPCLRQWWSSLRVVLYSTHALLHLTSYRQQRPPRLSLNQYLLPPRWRFLWIAVKDRAGIAKSTPGPLLNAAATTSSINILGPTQPRATNTQEHRTRSVRISKHEVAFRLWTTLEPADIPEPTIFSHRPADVLRSEYGFIQLTT